MTLRQVTNHEGTMPRLADKVVIITGGSGGIGSATARLFVHEGARVLLVDRTEGPLREIAAQIGGDIAWAAADVSKPEDTERYVQQAVTHFGGVDVLFANAGIEGAVRPLVEIAPEEFDRVLNVNVRGAWLGIKYAAPEIAKRGGGSILLTSSIAGLVGARGLGPYVASKHALIGLAKSAALELAAQNIRVNTVNPGPIENRMMRSIERQANPADPVVVKSGFQALIALQRYGTNEEIAQLALFLASNESSYCTGSVFVADGGMTAS
jgi:NAD(P)-dependent dehydrogenase (short-subunit alcohol dehydrogenase family)